MEATIIAVPLFCDKLPLPSVGRLAATKQWATEAKRALERWQQGFLQRRMLPPLEATISLTRLHPERAAQWEDLFARGHFLFEPWGVETPWAVPLCLASLARESTPEGRVEALWAMMRRLGSPRDSQKCLQSRRPRPGFESCIVRLHTVLMRMEATRRQLSIRETMEAFTAFRDAVSAANDTEKEFLWKEYLPGVMRRLRAGGDSSRLKRALCRQILRQLPTTHAGEPPVSLEHMWEEAAP